MAVAQQLAHGNKAAVVTAGWAVQVLGAAPNQARVTLPALMHEVHALTRLGVPLTSARTRWMFGTQRRLVRMCECEME